MNSVVDSKERAKHHVACAEYLFETMYPITQDPKLLIGVVENLFLASTLGMTAILEYDFFMKKIGSVGTDFNQKLRIFEKDSIPQHKLQQDAARIIKEIRSIVISRKKSPMEFRRKNAFIICSDKYVMKTVTVERIKRYLNRVRLLTEHIFKITTDHAGIFR